MSSSNVSYDLIWQIARGNSSYLVKRTTNGGASYSLDPLNSTAQYTKSASGFTNSHARGVVVGENGIELLTKDGSNFNKPASEIKVTPFNPEEANSKKTDDDELESALIKGYALQKTLA
ncbi:hypothetical protein DASB73_018960 [Starmerella bacillaris]|uniref:Ribosomal eL28/Mak16 domain-containing protein n=1 Tax=Starmerella bacillaris TaxID=1247836 RepID=A0AAV5RJN8_STABA|nr:hypothetical protein DASB73_018960 [Starmerella bacillaris]